jgi:predicted TIM-barrel fold metal-dependent hydrolase
MPTPIIDIHYHVFPFLGGASGFGSPSEHLRYLQMYIHNHVQPVHRLSDDAVIDEATTGAATLTGPDDLWNVNFRVGKNGRFMWTKDGVDYYIHYMPPSLRDNESPPDLALAQMAYAGVDMAVLQNATPYGRLDDYFADIQREHPQKFIGLASVDVVNAHTQGELKRLRRAVTELGLRGIYYANRGFFFDSFRRSFDDPCFSPFWELVRTLRIPVFWEVAAVPRGTEADYLQTIDRLNRWADQYPEIPCVYTHGPGPTTIKGSGGRGDLVDAMPDGLRRLLARKQFLVEVLFPIARGRNQDYPYAEARPAIEAMYRVMGAERLCWGSDMPNVERYCTYRQSLDYLRHYCDFIPAREMDLILGGNAARLLQIGLPTINSDARSTAR